MVKVQSQAAHQKCVCARVCVAAVALYDQLHTIQQKRDGLKAEIERVSKESPEKQHQDLLQQVKNDNQEIASMERKYARRNRGLNGFWDAQLTHP